MKIYDCFIFFNELEVLKIRLEELYEHVDYFVLVEANKTFAGKPKQFYFEENKTHFKKWSDKIIHIKVEDMPNISKLGEKIQLIGDKIYYASSGKIKSYIFKKIIPIRGITIHFKIGRWKPQAFQRNAISRGLKNISDNDVILISDADEIPNPKKFPQMIELLKKEKKIGFSQKIFQYYLNGFARDGWIGTRACTFKSFKKHFNSKAQNVRASVWDSKTLRKILRLKQIRIIQDGGWHFSFIGDAKKIRDKLDSISGSVALQKNLTDINNIEKNLKQGKIVYGKNHYLKFIKVDESFPKALRKNLKEYKHLIK